MNAKNKISKKCKWTSSKPLHCNTRLGQPNTTSTIASIMPCAHNLTKTWHQTHTHLEYIRENTLNTAHAHKRAQIHTLNITFTHHSCTRKASKIVILELLRHCPRDEVTGCPLSLREVAQDRVFTDLSFQADLDGSNNHGWKGLHNTWFHDQNLSYCH